MGADEKNFLLIRRHEFFFKLGLHRKLDAACIDDLIFSDPATGQTHEPPVRFNLRGAI
jgi:hypothetical protein